MSVFFRGLIVFLMVSTAQAQMAHEVLLLVNAGSQDSLRAANTFVSLRQIPRRNVVYLDIPERIFGGTATITPEEFTELIWNPANDVVKARGIDQQVLAWIYSVDFPIRVASDPNDRRQMSVTGLTFLRNEPIAPEQVEKAEYLSPIFGGPHARMELMLPALSLGVRQKGINKNINLNEEFAALYQGLGDAMPLPSMMLGYTGENGNDIETVLASLERGKQSDYRGKRSGVYFVTSDDVRSKCRAGLFEPMVENLKAINFYAEVTTNFPAGKKNVMGVMMGAEKVDPALVGSFAPGAMAENLTSWSAEFQKPQTKLTEWIKAGATASAGTVVEPYSNPDKFASARFFTHYASGCTMLESFYQSIASPLQILLLGDPMARPYALPDLSAKLFGGTSLKEDFTYAVKASAPFENIIFNYRYFIDGSAQPSPLNESMYYLRIKALSDGYHELRVVAQVQFLIEFNGMDEKGFIVNRLGRSVEVLQHAIRRIGTYEHGVKVSIGGKELPETLRLMSGERLLEEKPYSAEAELVLNEKVLGEGPNQFRVVGVYADGMEVSSYPVSFMVTFAK